MKLLNCVASVSVVALVLFSAPSQAQAHDFSISGYIEVVGDYFMPGGSLTSDAFETQDIAAPNTVNDYTGPWSSMYVVVENPQPNAYASYSISATERFDINIAVTNYQFAGQSLGNKAHELGLMFDIAAINRHADIDLRSTYYEFGLRHHLSTRLSFTTHVGINHNEEAQFYDFALSGEYALTQVLSLTLGYANQELNHYTSGNKAYAGARFTF